ncbi:MAG TPA: HAMP domain-containing sensor histidine kinase, partial [Kofleriaceae bacterium]|nr:HAMP domain-containing sensor histidine kinase [Kofleriaceae bacterium]
GAPIPEAVRGSMFDPFTTTKPGRGLGLGLYIVQQIVRAHGGTCDVTSDDAATTFTLRFPRAPAEPRRPQAIEGEPPPPDAEPP